MVSTRSIIRQARGLHSYNPIQSGCVLYLPLFALRGDAFYSSDIYRSACDITGALRRPQGRLFVGDDKITLPAPITNIPEGNEDRTTLAWVRKTALAAIGFAYSHGVYTTRQFWSVRVTATDGNVQSIHHSALHASPFSLTAGEWALIGQSYKGATRESTMFKNDASDSDTFSSDLLTTTNSDLWLGYADIGSDVWWDGYIGEFWFYNRVLTPAEVVYIHSRTMGRYQ